MWGRETPTPAPKPVTPALPAALPERTADTPSPSRRSRRPRDTQPPAPQSEAAAASEPVALPAMDLTIPKPVAALPVAPELPAADSAPAGPVLEQPAPDTSTGPFTPTTQTGGRRARRARLRADEPTVLPDAVLTPAEPFELLEPAAAPEQPAMPEPIVVPEADVEVEPVAATEQAPTEPESLPDAHALPQEQARSAAADVDEFATAAALFSFTGETPVQRAAAARDADEASKTPATEPAKPDATPGRPRTRTSLRRIAATGFSVGVMGIVGLMTVGMTTPVEAVAASSAVETNLSVLAAADAEAGIDTEEIQAYVTPADTENADVSRDENYDTVTMAEIASESGISNYSSLFVNDPNSAIQWPFAVGVPMSYGFGLRSGVMHEGIDFVPGYGAPIQAIADGTVRIATNAGGAYGVTIVIDHEIDGQLVSSRYGHMIYGSLKVVPGQKVSVGQVIGSTGNTGRSYGAHLHFEILMDGTTAIDPLPWLRQHAGG
ncbi:hypothetical protein GCM10017607_01850 [Microbacterium thalassium]|nr:hypothetical protein GCM10017607_01850 [Microbacterium thalassium]